MRKMLSVMCGLFLLAHSVSATTLYLKACVDGCVWNDATSWSTVDSSGVDDSGPPTINDDAILEAGSGNVELGFVVGLNRARTVSMTAGAGDYAGTVSCAGDFDTPTGIILGLDITGTMWQASAASTISMPGCQLRHSPVAGQTFTFEGASKIYGYWFVSTGVWATSTYVITGSNTFERFYIVAGLIPNGNLTFTFPAGATTTLPDIRTDGTAQLFLRHATLQSDTPGVATFFAKPSGVTNVQSVVVVDTVITDDTTWCNGSTGGDGGGNTGWTFIACPNVLRQQLLGVGD